MKPRPTTAIRTFFFGTGESVIKVNRLAWPGPGDEVGGGPDVGDASVAGLSFDDEMTVVLEVLERSAKRRPVYFARAHGDFGAPGTRGLGPKGVFNVHLADPR